MGRFLVITASVRRKKHYVVKLLVATMRQGSSDEEAEEVIDGDQGMHHDGKDMVNGCERAGDQISCEPIADVNTVQCPDDEEDWDKDIKYNYGQFEDVGGVGESGSESEEKKMFFNRQQNHFFLPADSHPEPKYMMKPVPSRSVRRVVPFETVVVGQFDDDDDEDGDVETDNEKDDVNLGGVRGATDYIHASKHKSNGNLQSQIKKRRTSDTCTSPVLPGLFSLK